MLTNPNLRRYAITLPADIRARAEQATVRERNQPGSAFLTQTRQDLVRLALRDALDGLLRAKRMPSAPTAERRRANPRTGESLTAILNLSPLLVEEIDQWAADLGVTRSRFIADALDDKARSLLRG